MEIKTSEHIFICGMTGSGKTEMAKQLWNGYNNRVYIDPKIENSDLAVGNTILIDNPQSLSLALSKGYTSILYQPSNLDVEDFNEVCRILYNHGNIAIYNDEASFYCDSHKIPSHLRNILMRGRSRGVGMINLSQRPNAINNLCISESTHHFIYRLNLEADVLKMRMVLPKKYHQTMMELPKYHYIYSHVYEGQQLCNPIKI